MNSFRKCLFASCLLGLSLFAAIPEVRADDYWHNHWGWYNNSYRPYYNYYYNSPYANRSPYYGYGNYSGGYYAPGYYGQGYYGQYYGPNYYRGGGNVQVGPLQFGWW